MILKDIKLRKKLKKLIKQNVEVEDVLLFGSVIRGKKTPGDIDIIVKFKNKIDKHMEYVIRKELEKDYNDISIISKTNRTLVESSFDARESFLFEAISLITGENLAKKHGFESLGMFKYNFKNWDKLKKTKFYYALNGRGSGEGMVSSSGSIKLSDNVLLVPLDKIEEIRQFLESWEMEFIYIPTLIPQRLNRKKILG